MKPRLSMGVWSISPAIRMVKSTTFVDGTGTRSSLPLHTLNGQPYLLGFFLLGAYQDVMGDLHNLFGSVNEAHVYLDPDEPDGFYIEETIPGFSIGRVLGIVQYETSQLSRMIKSKSMMRSNRTK